jgi:hypothetical protein
MSHLKKRLNLHPIANNNDTNISCDVLALGMHYHDIKGNLIIVFISHSPLKL